MSLVGLEISYILQLSRTVEGAEREARLAQNIIRTTDKVSVGPLEYCGTALAFRQRGKGRSIVCVFQPLIPTLF